MKSSITTTTISFKELAQVLSFSTKTPKDMPQEALLIITTLSNLMESKRSQETKEESNLIIWRRVQDKNKTKQRLYL